MKYTKVKTAKQVTLTGVSVEMDFNDTNLASVIIRGQGNGEVLKLAIDGYSSFSAYVPAPPETEKRYRLAGSIGGAEILPIVFGDKYEADRKLHELTVSSQDNTLTVEEFDQEV